MTSSFRSNMDHACAIAQSIFVTNFPDYTSSKELWKLSQSYGTVVDIYIPNRRSKAGKRFSFVWFIKVDNVDRLEIPEVEHSSDDVSTKGKADNVVEG
nr:ChaC-like family protein [Tanacetum cinerariifolium]